MNHLRLTAILILGILTGCSSLSRKSSPAKDPNTYLTITGSIDGSEKFLFTRNRIYWTHLHWSEPVGMKFCGERWVDLKETPKKWAAFSNLDLAHAYIVTRQGRDIIALETVKDGFILYLSDSPNGADDYSVVIAIPPLGKK
jgi:hypothetical protein